MHNICKIIQGESGGVKAALNISNLIGYTKYMATKYKKTRGASSKIWQTAATIFFAA